MKLTELAATNKQFSIPLCELLRRLSVKILLSKVNPVSKVEFEAPVQRQISATLHTFLNSDAR